MRRVRHVDEVVALCLVGRDELASLRLYGREIGCVGIGFVGRRAATVILDRRKSLPGRSVGGGGAATSIVDRRKGFATSACTAVRNGREGVTALSRCRVSGDGREPGVDTAQAQRCDAADMPADLRISLP